MKSSSNLSEQTKPFIEEITKEEEQKLFIMILKVFLSIMTIINFPISEKNENEGINLINLLTETCEKKELNEEKKNIYELYDKIKKDFEKTFKKYGKKKEELNYIFYSLEYFKNFSKSEVSIEDWINCLIENLKLFNQFKEELPEKIIKTINSLIERLIETINQCLISKINNIFEKQNIIELKNKIEILMKEKNDIALDNNSKQIKIEKLNKTIEEISEKLKNEKDINKNISQKRIQDNEINKNNMNDILNKMELMKKDFVNANKKLKEELQIEIKNTNNKYEELKKNNEELQIEIKNTNNKYEELKKNNEELQIEIKNTNIKYEELKKNNEKLENQYKIINAKCVELEKNNEGLKNQNFVLEDIKLRLKVQNRVLTRLIKSRDPFLDDIL